MYQATSATGAGLCHPTLRSQLSIVRLHSTKHVSRIVYRCPSHTLWLRFEPIKSHRRLRTTTAATTPRASSSSSSSAPLSPPPQQQRTIAIAVDTTTASLSACTWALAHLYKSGDTIHILHCVPSLPPKGLYALDDGRLVSVDLQKLLQNEDAYLRAAEHVVAEQVYKIFKPAGVPFIINVIQENAVTGGSKGNVAEELCKRADALDAAALVLSSHSRGGLGEMIMGSVAAECARHCDVPVVVLHEEEYSQKSSTAAHAPAVSALWLKDLLRGVATGVPGAVGTAAESIADIAAAAAGADSNVQSPGEKEALVSSSDFSFDEGNLIGQTVTEIPGIDDSLLPTGAEAAGETVVEKEEAYSSATTEPRHFIITIDDSDVSEYACEWAVSNLWRPGDVFHLLHVIPALPAVIGSLGPMSGLSSSIVTVMEPPTEAYKAASEECIERRCAGTLRTAGVDFEKEVAVELTDGSVGGVGRVICDRADVLGAAGVVIGSHSRGGVSELLLGSVASWVCHHAGRPVIVLH